MTAVRRKLLLAAGTALFLCAIPLAGCSHNQSLDAAAPPAAPAPGAPTGTQVDAQRAIAEQHMSQAREMAVAAWRQSHPGQKLPPGF